MHYEIAAFQHAIAPVRLPNMCRMEMQDSMSLTHPEQHWVWQKKEADFATPALSVASPFWLAVADGVSASPAAALASRSWLGTLQKHILQQAQGGQHASAPAQIRAAWQQWQGKYLTSATYGASTTLACVAFDGSRYTAINCGDSRIWLLRQPAGQQATEWQQISQDHTAWQYLLDEGEVSATQRAEYASIYQGLMHCLTLGDNLEPDGLDDDTDYTPASDQPVLHIHTGELQAGDILLLATDGLHDTLSAAEMHALWQSGHTLPEKVQALKAAYIKAGAPDDCSVQACRLVL